MKKYLCKRANCQVLLDTPGYCSRHTPAPRADKPAFVDAQRSNQALYQSSAWRKLRRMKLNEQPVCCRCGISRNDGARLECHHIRPPRGNEELFFDVDNVMVVCESCHKLITGKEISKRKRP